MAMTRGMSSHRRKGKGTGPDGKIEITLPDGTSVKVGHNVGLVTLRRVMTVLRR